MSILRRSAPVLLAALAACTREDGFERVLVVVTDAAHAGQLSCYGNPHPTTPAIDAVAAEGVRFARAFSNNTWTLASTGSLHTGRLQETHGAVTNEHRLPEEERTLAELFAEAGYETAAFVQMAYASGEFGMDQGFDEFRYYGESDGGRSRRAVPEVRAWLAEHAGERWFVYLHLRRPHSPYRPGPRALAPLEVGCPLADGSRDAELESADLFDRRDLPPAELAHVRHLYQANLTTIDTLLAAILDEARGQGALVVLTSDHGEALGQHGVFGHGAYLYGESIDVPLVFWWPGAVPRVDEEPASTIDVLPTLLELCGLPVPRGVDGRSLVPRLERGGGAAGAEPVLVTGRYTESHLPRVGVIDGDWKLVWDGPEDVALFDRRSDPADERDRSAEEPAVVERLSAIAEAWRAEHADAARRGVAVDAVSPEVREDLRALGYGGE